MDLSGEMTKQMVGISEDRLDWIKDTRVDGCTLGTDGLMLLVRICPSVSAVTGFKRDNVSSMPLHLEEGAQASTGRASDERRNRRDSGVVGARGRSVKGVGPENGNGPDCRLCSVAQLPDTPDSDQYPDRCGSRGGNRYRFHDLYGHYRLCAAKTGSVKFADCGRLYCRNRPHCPGATGTGRDDLLMKGE